MMDHSLWIQSLTAVLVREEFEGLLSTIFAVESNNRDKDIHGLVNIPNKMNSVMHEACNSF